MNTELMFSHISDDWKTPEDLYDGLNKEFNFNFDPCPLECDFDGLNLNWRKRVFVNPPYSNVKNFMYKAISELALGNSDVVVFLVPSRTDTKWFHNIVMNFAKEVRFIKGRLKFGDHKNSAPLPSMIIVFGSKK